MFVADEYNARVDEFRTTSRPSCSIRVASAKVPQQPEGKSGRLRFHVRCDQSASVVLAGKLTERVQRNHRTKTLKVAAVRGSVTAGARITLTVKLPRAALAALAADARESARFTLTVTNANGTSSATAKVARLKPVTV